MIMPTTYPTRSLAAASQLPRSPEALIRISVASRLTGISVWLLRKWEHRYGWPQSATCPDGFRGYHPDLIRLLDVVGHLMQSGRSIRDILNDPALGIRRHKVGFSAPGHVDGACSAVAGDAIRRSPRGQRFHRGQDQSVDGDGPTRLRQQDGDEVAFSPDDRGHGLHQAGEQRTTVAWDSARRRVQDFSRIPSPATSAGKRLRMDLERALLMNDHGAVRRIQAEMVRITPADRHHAVVALLQAVAGTSQGAALD
jgi:hypothetical protein